MSNQKKIYKYVLDVKDGDQELKIPHSGRIVHVGKQNSQICLWVEFNGYTLPAQKRYFNVFGTGHHIPSEFGHIGTVQMDSFVWHVYEGSFK